MSNWRPIKNAVAVLLIGVAVLSKDGLGVDLKIPQPSSAISSKVSSIAKTISNRDDKKNFGIFNKVFADRVNDYNTDTQKLQDVYVLAAKKYFKGNLKDKYLSLDSRLTDLFKSVLGDDNKVLSEEDKKSVAEHFSGLAYNLLR